MLSMLFLLHRLSIGIIVQHQELLLTRGQRCKQMVNSKYRVGASMGQTLARL